MKHAIAMIAFTNYQSDGRVRRFAEALAAEGIQTDVIALRENTPKPVYQLRGVRVFQVPLTRKRGNIFRYLFEYIAFFCMSSLWITGLFLKHRYKVIHVHNMPDFLVFTTLIPKLFGVKVILDIHDPLPELFSAKFNFNQNGMGIKILRFEEKVSFKFADYVMTVTDMVKSLLLKKGVDSGRISTIINAPDSRIFKRTLNTSISNPSAEKRFTLLFAGTIVERNGLGNLVRALPDLVQLIPNILFRVIGNGDFTEGLKALVAELNLQKHVEILPTVPLEQIPQEILKADAVAWFPERNDFMDLALSVKVLEALIMGKPVIGTKTKCHEYYFTENEQIFTDSTDTQAISQGIFHLYQNYEKIKPSPEAIQRFIARFDWEVEREKYLEIINRLANAEPNKKPKSETAQAM